MTDKVCVTAKTYLEDKFSILRQFKTTAEEEGMTISQELINILFLSECR